MIDQAIVIELLQQLTTNGMNDEGFQVANTGICYGRDYFANFAIKGRFNGDAEQN